MQSIYRRLNIVQIFAALTFTCSTSMAQYTRTERSEFVAALQSIRNGTHQSEVERVLGRPDKSVEVSTLGGLARSEAMRRFGSNMVWYFGTNEFSDFPTMGQIHFDLMKNVVGVVGGSGDVFNSSVIDEESLRKLLRLVYEMPTAEAEKWNPRTVVKVVNAMQEVGKDDAIAVLKEYWRLSMPSDQTHQQVELLFKLLLEIPANTGHLPKTRFGIALFGEPDELQPFPRFPVHVIDGIPVLLVRGYDKIGVYYHDSFDEQFEWPIKHGVWRTDKLEVLQISERELEKIKEQLLELMKSYLDAPRAKVTLENIHIQLDRIRVR